jgi:hypothetical protein
VIRLLRSGGGSGGIFEAVKAGDLEAVRRLLAEDPSLLNARDAGSGATPLHWAAWSGHAAIVSLLISSGADTSAKNRKGETPLNVAERAGRAEVIRLLRQPGGS